MAGAVREGLIDEGCSVLDAGMVATEMLYHLVGSRELDGGAMVTASHNPKAYTGVKLVREGALALSGDAGIGDVRDRSRRGCPSRPAAAASRRSTSTTTSTSTSCRFIDPSAVQPLQVVVDGGNGMAGPMVGPSLERLGIDPIDHLLGLPTASSPTTSPTRCSRRTAGSSSSKVLDRGRRPRDRLGRRRRPLLLHRRPGRVRRRRLPHRAARRGSCSRSEPGATILYDVRASRAVPDTVASSAARSYVNRVGHAFFKAALREHDAAFGGEVSGHYYFRDFWCADSGTIPALLVLELLSSQGRPLSELVGAFREPLLHLRRDQLRGRRPGGEDARDRRALPGRRDLLARRRLGRLPRLALQRPALEHRAAAAAQPRVAGLAARTWRPSATRSWR